MKYKIINSDVYSALYHLKNSSIDLAITSPPYWGQRDYGFEGQIGNESDYYDYIFKLVTIFKLLREKLTDEGIFFLNIGDKYLNKYGKTPLAMIPYKLVYYMIKDGWVLNDIIIWYKPNHMPSSIKNRFTNSYEPVFVLSKQIKNIYKKKIENSRSNILKVNLQPTPYKHVAAYPEKLVENLLNKVDLNENATILDPFAGSGTTLKVAKEFNSYLNAIMIEKNEEYVDIIKQRCNLDQDLKIFKYNFIPFNYTKAINERPLTLFDKTNYSYINKVPDNGFLKIFTNKDEYISFLEKFKSHSIKSQLQKSATCFIGCINYDIDIFYQTSELNSYGWIIRNIIAVENNNLWFPVFMIVEDNKHTDYIFNYKNLNLKSKNNYSRNWIETEFRGMKVVDSVNKNSGTGKIAEILERYSDGFPEFVIVEWGNNNFTKEYIVKSDDEINKNVELYFKNSVPIFKEKKIIFDLKKNIDYNKNVNNKINLLNRDKNYNGKFKNLDRFNWGASPGARSSVENEYFSLQRLYKVEQPLIADYLNYKRAQKSLTKQELVNLFSPNYKHTVGHWLRKDFGGSLPTPEDWEKLDSILDFKSSVTDYVCKTALKFQTVKNGAYKMPDDFISNESLDMLNNLIK
jgi:site-specific DNA-methyltransferase (cytosine-N4-specific)